MTMHAMVKRVKKSSSHDEALDVSEEQLRQWENVRLKFLSRMDPFSHYRDPKANKKGKEGGEQQVHQLPPLDQHTLHLLVEKLYGGGRFKRAVQSKVDPTLIDKFPGMFSGQENFAKFMATQQAAIESQVVQEHDPELGTQEETQERISKETLLCYAAMNMLTDSHPFRGWPKWDDGTILEQAVKRLDLFNDELAREDDVLDGAPLDYPKFISYTFNHKSTTSRQ